MTRTSEGNKSGYRALKALWLPKHCEELQGKFLQNYFHISLNLVYVLQRSIAGEKSQMDLPRVWNSVALFGDLSPENHISISICLLLWYFVKKFQFPGPSGLEKIISAFYNQSKNHFQSVLKYYFRNVCLLFACKLAVANL